LDKHSFLRVAIQRSGEIEILLAAQLNQLVMYLTGYVVECRFKALVLDQFESSRGDVKYEVGIVPHGEAKEFADLANQFLGWVKERLDEHTN
jgi:hypothetical protein